MNNVEKNIIQLIPLQPRKAVEAIYDHYGAQLLGVVFQMTKNKPFAEDILQESFIKIFQKLSTYQPEKAKLFTWLLRICRNTTIDHLRRNQRGQTGDLEEVDFNVKWAERPVAVEMMDLKDHVGQLSPKYQSVIDLLYFKGFSQKEASDELAIPLGTIKTRVKGALQRLRRLYKTEIAIFILLNYLI